MKNQLVKNGDKPMYTVREVAGQLRCNPETIKGYIRGLWPGLTRKGKTTYLSEAQVTVILEKMKRGQDNQHNIQSQLCMFDTAGSRAARVAMQLKVIDEAHRAIEAELRTYQRIAEAGGLIMSDRDDVINPYRRRR